MANYKGLHGQQGSRYIKGDNFKRRCNTNINVESGQG